MLGHSQTIFIILFSATSSNQPASPSNQTNNPSHSSASSSASNVTTLYQETTHSMNTFTSSSTSSFTSATPSHQQRHSPALPSVLPPVLPPALTRCYTGDPASYQPSATAAEIRPDHYAEQRPPMPMQPIPAAQMQTGMPPLSSIGHSSPPEDVSSTLPAMTHSAPLPQQQPQSQPLASTQEGIPSLASPEQPPMPTQEVAPPPQEPPQEPHHVPSQAPAQTPTQAPAQTPTQTPAQETPQQPTLSSLSTLPTPVVLQEGVTPVPPLTIDSPMTTLFLAILNGVIPPDNYTRRQNHPAFVKTTLVTHLLTERLKTQPTFTKKDAEKEWNDILEGPYQAAITLCRANLQNNKQLRRIVVQPLILQRMLNGETFPVKPKSVGKRKRFEMSGEDIDEMSGNKRHATQVTLKMLLVDQVLKSQRGIGPIHAVDNWQRSLHHVYATTEAISEEQKTEALAFLTESFQDTSAFELCPPRNTSIKHDKGTKLYRVLEELMVRFSLREVCLPLRPEEETDEKDEKDDTVEMEEGNSTDTAEANPEETNPSASAPTTETETSEDIRAMIHLLQQQMQHSVESFESLNQRLTSMEHSWGYPATMHHMNGHGGHCPPYVQQPSQCHQGWSNGSGGWGGYANPMPQHQPPQPPHQHQPSPPMPQTL